MLIICYCLYGNFDSRREAFRTSFLQVLNAEFEFYVPGKSEMRWTFEDVNLFYLTNKNAAEAMNKPDRCLKC